ncbi:MAG: hypothetical protein KFF72_05315 [Arthrospira sp. SH-MAG29]|nr:hypothetical protein [Arthrospira sp. SH-MAG29]MBS0015773.1 hypothetical protein [Arthrospira sp. SH-MAG29]
MTNYLLIVFGGTTEDQVVFETKDSANDSQNFPNLTSSNLFSKEDLDSNNVDVLQINLLTINPSLSFRANKNSSLKNLNGVWLTAKPQVGSRYLKSEYPHKADLLKYLEPLGKLGQSIDSANWSEKNYTEASTARGMTVKVFNDFAGRSKDLITEFLNSQGQKYDSVFMLAHSRGCGLALQSLSQNDVNSKSDIDMLQLSDNVLTHKLQRVVLLDPVSKNATDKYGFGTNANKIIPPANAKIVAELSNKDKEIHIVSKSKSTVHDYDSYVDILVGEQGDRNYELNFRNVYVHIADMAHEGMLSSKLHDHFTEYLNIIKNQPWQTTYFNKEEVSLDNLYQLSEKIEIGDRKQAFYHCFQRKNSN